MIASGRPNPNYTAGQFIDKRNESNIIYIGTHPILRCSGLSIEISNIISSFFIFFFFLPNLSTPVPKDRTGQIIAKMPESKEPSYNYHYYSKDTYADADADTPELQQGALETTTEADAVFGEITGKGPNYRNV